MPFFYHAVLMDIKQRVGNSAYDPYFEERLDNTTKMMENLL